MFKLWDKNIVITSRDGMIKRSKLGDFKLSRYSKPTSCMKLKENDLVIDAFVEEKDTLFLTTDSGYGLSFKTEEVPVVGVKAAGVKAMKLKDDHLVSINEYSMEEAEYISIILLSFSKTDSFLIATLKRREEPEQESIPIEEEKEEKQEEKTIPKKEKISLKEIDDRLMTIDDFLK